MLNPAAVNQISASQTFPITTNFNIHTAGAISTRAAVSASAWNINQNLLIGSITIGSGAGNAEKILGSLSINNNQVGNALSIIANRTAISASTTISNNALLGGPVSLTMASSSIGYQLNVGNAAITNGFQNAGATTGNNSLQVVSNWFGGAIISVSGSDAGGLSNPRYIGGNYLFNGYNLSGATNINLSLNGSGSSMLSTMMMGHELGITGSNGYDSNVGILTPGIGAGSAFFGRWNSQSGNRARTAETVFAIGTGTSTSLTKTGFLIDSGSNTYVEGTFNVSGSTTLSGSLIVSGSSIFSGSLSVKGNTTFTTNDGITTNVILGNNAAANSVGLAQSVAIGQEAMQYASGSNQNIAIGIGALKITSGSGNFGLGTYALTNNTTGETNIAIGTGAGYNNATGNRNTFIGFDAGSSVITGSSNTFVGPESGADVTGSNNTIIGRYRGDSSLESTIIIAAGTSQKLRHQNEVFQVTGSVAASAGLSALGEFKLSTASNKPAGIVSVNGSATVTNSLVTTDSIILVTTQNGVVGTDEYPAVVNAKGTGTFDIAHSYGGTLNVAYLIINPA